MAKQEIMAEGTNTGPEAVVGPPVESGAQSPVPGMSLELYNTLSKRHSPEAIQEQRAKHKTHDEFLADAEQEAERIRTVLANAQLSEEERLKAAGELLGVPLTTIQTEALKAMHEVGKKRSEAGVFHYTNKEIGQKIKEGGEAFTKEEWKALIKSGLAGRLPPAEYAALGIDPTSFDSDPKLKRIVANAKTTGDAGNADDKFFSNKIIQIKKLAEEAEIDIDLAQILEPKLQAGLEQTDDKFLPYKAFLSYEEFLHLQEQAAKEGGSEFSMAKQVYEYCMVLPRLIDQRDNARAEVKNLINLADQAGVLADARDRALEFYKQFKAAKRRDKWGRDKQQTVDYAMMQSYNETFWANSVTLKPLESTLRGAGKYFFDGIVAEAYKELHNDRTPSLNVIAKEEFENIQEQRIRGRKTERKYDVNEYYGRRSYQLVAEYAAEMPEAALALTWVRLAELPNTDMETVDRTVKGIKQELDELLGTNRVHLETDEGDSEASEDSPYYIRAQAGIEAVTNVVGYEKIIGWDEKPNWEGGGEVAASYVRDFAAGYIGHHDAIYLMRRVARILYKLRTYEEGTYWTGHPFSEEKVDPYYMKAYRQKLQKEIQDDAATHELFITDQDFDKRLERKLGKDGKPEKGLDGRETIERNLKYSFEDPIEELLLDPNGSVWAAREQQLRATGVSQTDIDVAKNRYDIRIKVFRDIKTRLDKQEGWAGKSVSDRQQRVREIILAKMQEESIGTVIAGETKRALAELSTLRGSAYDKILWAWVKKYNDNRMKQGLQIAGDADWCPSGWDLVRMAIDRPEKLVDRNLTDEQLDAMYEEVKLDSLTEVEKALLQNEVRSQFIVGRDYALLEMEDALYGGIRTRIRDKDGKVIDPNHMTMRVFDIVKGRLKTAIAEEWDELEQFKSTMGAAIEQAKQAHDFAKAKELQIELDKKILGAQFLVTHAFKAAGLVNGELPVSNGQLRSDTAINFLGNMLKAYGVNVAFGEGISHNSKDTLYEILERGRRAWQSEWKIAVQEEMLGTYPVPELDYDTTGKLVPQYDAQGKLIRAEAYRTNVYGEKVYISERRRIVSPGSPSEHQGIVDPMLNNSTSGGLAVPEFTDELADYLFAVPMVKIGASNLNALHGVLKGLDEAQARQIQKIIFTSNDAVYNATERMAAYGAKKAFSGGKNAEGKSQPGFANEPFEGGYKSADWLLSQLKLIRSYGLVSTTNYIYLMQQYRESGLSYSKFQDEWTSKQWKGDQQVTEGRQQLPSGKDLERLRQLSYSDLDSLNKNQIDEIYSTMGGVYHNFTDYLSARKGCIQSRGGRALRSWEEENHKSFYVFRRKIREAMMGKKDADGKWSKKPERGFVMRLGYSPEVGSEVIMRLLITVLMDGGYHVLRDFEVDQRVRDGTEILSSALTDQEKKAGFVIPKENTWSTLRPDLQKALRTIRRRGLLEFMTEEGYKLEYDVPEVRDNKGKVIQQAGKDYKEILGQALPPLVQDLEIAKDNRKVKNAFNP